MREKRPLELYQRLRVGGLRVCLLAARRLGRLLRRLPARAIREPAPRKTGLSVVIPERGGGAFLAPCLDRLFAALAGVAEPVEVIIVVNGSSREDYRELVAHHPSVRWIWHAEPLGFAAAVRAGLALVRHDWVYLLNNDMELAADAIREVLAWRAPHVFAVASQIFFRDPEARREETGWTELVPWEQCALFDVVPEKSPMVRGHLYAGGGASLFQRAPLARFLQGPVPYAPFYWEDVEWGIRAWRHGYEVLFCPTSHATHRHRATVSRYYGEAEVERIFARNRLHFELRNIDQRSSGAIALQIRSLDPSTRRELTSFSSCLGILRLRLRDARSPGSALDFRYQRRKFYPRPFRQQGDAPVLLVVAPYALQPAVHGSSRRVAAQLKRLRRHFRVILLGDEELLYGPDAAASFTGLSSVHLIGWTRVDGDRRTRMRSHCHAILRSELDRILSVYRPDLVQVEHVELAGLRDPRRHHQKWLLDLHDVLLSPGVASERAADAQERRFSRRYDAVVTCSREDAALVGSQARIVPNGVDPPTRRYVASKGSRRILFAGPFRYPPNWDGIRAFLRLAFPQVRDEVSDVELVVLGGAGAVERARGCADFRQPGVRVLGAGEDVRGWHDRSALTINPIHGIRGSSLKLLESVSAGRVCVSTRDGARGFTDAGFHSLVLVDDLRDFAPVVARLLIDEPHRLRREVPRNDILEAYSWDRAAAQLVAIHQSLLARRDASS